MNRLSSTRAFPKNALTVGSRIAHYDVTALIEAP